MFLFVSPDPRNGRRLKVKSVAYHDPDAARRIAEGAADAPAERDTESYRLSQSETDLVRYYDEPEGPEQ